MNSRPGTEDAMNTPEPFDSLLVESVSDAMVAISPDSAFKYVSYFVDWVGQDGRPPEE